MRKLRFWLMGLLICAVLLSGCSVKEEKAVKKESSKAAGISKVAEDEQSEEKGIPYIVVDDEYNVVGTNHFEEVQCIDLSLDSFYHLGVNCINDWEPGAWGDREHERGFRIRSGAFKNCSALRQITFIERSNVTEVAEDAFQGCSKDLTVYCKKDSSLWKRLQEIGIHVEDVNPIENRKSDESVQQKYPGYSLDTENIFVLDTGNTLLGYSGGLNEGDVGKRTVVKLPKEIKKIAKYVFNQAGSGIAEIIIPEQVEEIERGAFSDTAFGKITFMGNNLRKIGDNAFKANFSSMGEETFELPEGVVDIGEGVFVSTEAKEIIIPESVKTVGKDFISLNSTSKLVVKGKDTEFETWTDFMEENMERSETVVYCYKDSKAEKFFKKLGCEISYLE